MFWCDIALGHSGASEINRAEESAYNGFLLEDESLFSTRSISDVSLQDIYGPKSAAAQSEEPTSPGQTNQQNQDVSTNLYHQSPTRANEAQFDGDDVPKGRSIAHSMYNNKNAYFISFDIETGGEYVGMQLSAQLCMIILTAEGTSTVKDKAESITFTPDVFDSYVNPNKVPGLWDEHAIAVHGIAPNQRRIMEADDMRTVWHNFMEWISRHVPAGEVATLVAWNGAACDMKWLWVLTQAPNLPYMMPPQLQFFINPYRVIEKYASCKINKKRSKLKSYQLGSVWIYLDKEHRNLNNFHNSRDDVIAQSAVLTHEDFIPFINRAKSVQTINDIFAAAQKNNWRKKMVPAASHISLQRSRRSLWITSAEQG